MRYNVKSVELHVHDGGHFDVHWSAVFDGEMPGFGILSFYRNFDGTYSADTETMSADFCKAVFNKFIEQTMSEQEKLSGPVI